MALNAMAQNETDLPPATFRTMSFFVDEAGDPVLFDAKGRILVGVCGRAKARDPRDQGVTRYFGRDDFSGSPSSGTSKDGKCRVTKGTLRIILRAS